MTDNSDHSDNSDNSVNDSYNSTDSSSNIDVAIHDAFKDESTTVATAQQLYGAVALISVTASGGGEGEAVVKSGDIKFDGDSLGNFGGINTMTQNTGVGSLGQAATAVGANANVNFGK